MATILIDGFQADHDALAMLRSVWPADAKAMAYVSMAIRRLEIVTKHPAAQKEEIR